MLKKIYNSPVKLTVHVARDLLDRLESKFFGQIFHLDSACSFYFIKKDLESHDEWQSRGCQSCRIALILMADFVLRVLPCSTHLAVSPNTATSLKVGANGTRAAPFTVSLWSKKDPLKR